MASTPEGRVKNSIRRALCELRDRGARVYYHMPVQNGMGKPSLDFVGCINGRFFAIEAKAPGKKPTVRQEETISEMRAAGAVVFVYDGSAPKELAACLAMLLE